MKVGRLVLAALMLVARSGSRTQDVTDTLAGRAVAGRCLEITSPVFMIVEARPTDRYPDVPLPLVVPPESSLVPVSLAEAQYGQRSVPIGIIESIVRPTTKFQVNRLLLKKSLEGDTIAITAVGGQREVEVSNLFDRSTVVSLLDSAQTGAPLPSPILLDPSTRRCRDTGRALLEGMRDPTDVSTISTRSEEVCINERAQSQGPGPLVRRPHARCDA